MISEILDGHQHLELAPKAIQSACRLPIYQGACAILSLPQADRKAAIEKIPLLIRPYVEAEVVRLWKERREI